MPRRKAENKTIEVILLKQDKHLGEIYEVVKVKPIFARNVLLPKKIAVLSTAFNLNKYKQKMEASQKDVAKKISSLDELLMRIQWDNGIVLIRKANKDDVLYAQISSEDIVAAIKSIYKFDVEAYYFKIKKKIKAVGTYTVPFIYKELKKDLKLTIEKENKEEEKVEEKKEEVVAEVKEEKKEEVK